MSASALKSQCIEKIHIRKLHRLRKEEDVLKKMLKKYKDGLHALQIEELTIKHHLGKMRTQDTDSLNSLAPDTGGLHSIKSLDHGQITGGGFLNLTSVNPEATPLIQRMLNDSMAYDEEDADT